MPLCLSNKPPHAHAPFLSRPLHYSLRCLRCNSPSPETRRNAIAQPTVPPDTQSRYFRPLGLFVSCFDNQAEPAVSIRKCLLILSPTPTSLHRGGNRAEGQRVSSSRDWQGRPSSHRAGSRRQDRRATTFPIGLLCNGLGACPPIAPADWPAAPTRRNKLDQQLCFFMVIRTSLSCCSVRPPSDLFRFLFLSSVDSALAADRSGHHWASLTILYLIASRFPTLSSLKRAPSRLLESSSRSAQWHPLSVQASGCALQPASKSPAASRPPRLGERRKSLTSPMSPQLQRW